MIVLDPGHGGRDPGAVGARGTLEKAVVLAVAHELRRVLRATGRYRVALTREGDVFVPLRARLAFARRSGAALMVSLHADAAPRARGVSAYTLSNVASDGMASRLADHENAADRPRGRGKAPPLPRPVRTALAAPVRREVGADSVRFARLAVAEAGRVALLLADPHREAGFVVLQAPGIPSVLVELGFLSHPGDEAPLRRAGHRRKLAGALARAVDRWFAGADRLLVAGDTG